MIKSIIYKTIVRQKYIIHYDLSMTICRKLSGCARCLESHSRGVALSGSIPCTRHLNSFLDKISI